MDRLPRLPWRVLAGVACALIGLGLAALWFRDSSFAEVETVSITGSTSSESAQVRDALTSVADGMSTLHVDTGALHDAVKPFVSVADLRVRADFPHALRIEVVEHAPVATVETGGSRVPATGSGVVLSGVRAEDLPTVVNKGPLADGRVKDRHTLAALAVAAAAPRQLRARAAKLWWGGGGEDAPVKWTAAARVLAEDSAAGASYLDLRVPRLVAAGGVGPITPEATTTPQVVPSQAQP